MERCVEAFAPEVFVNHYGSTEIYTFSIGRDQRRSRAAPAGRRSTRACKLEPNGEICVHLSCDEAFAGYWNRPDADAKAIRDGWYYTGDTGHLDADGDLWLDGRIDDMIVSGGENVHPLEVEDVLVAPPGRPGGRGRRRARRAPRPARRRGRRRRRDGRGARRPLPRLAARALQASARVPLRAELPKSASGKILRRVLRDESKERA